MLTSRILITRPLPQALVTAEQVRRLGGIPIIDPLLKIYHHPENLPEGDFSAILCTSQEAIRSLAMTSISRSTPLWCAGSQSAQLALESGFTTVHISEFGGADGVLRDFSSQSSPLDNRILYVSGDVITLNLASALTQKGYNCVRAILYKTEASQKFQMASEFPIESLNGIVFFSKRTVDIFFNLLKNEMLTRIHAGFLSDEIAQRASHAPWKSITIPDTMNSDQLIHDLMRKICDDQIH